MTDKFQFEEMEKAILQAIKEKQGHITKKDREMTKILCRKLEVAWNRMIERLGTLARDPDFVEKIRRAVKQKLDEEALKIINPN